MATYFGKVILDQTELEDIMRTLDEAKKTIYKCYSRLQEVDALILREEKEDADSCN